jgi:pyruvate dehydrogenase E1 component beta subunit
MTYKDAAAEALLMAMEKNERVFLMGEGVDNITGVYGQVLPAYKKFGSSRVIDTPLSENGLTGFAIGAALDGMRPVLVHQRDDFMLLAMDQVMNQAANLRYASGGHHKVPLTILSFVARRPGEGVQHSHSLQSIFAHFPGIKVGMPASPVDVKGMILAAIFDDDPVIILEHRHTPMFEQRENVPTEYYETPFASLVVTPGSDITIATVSITLLNAIEACAKLESDGIYPEIIDLRWLRPLDIDSIIRSVKKTGRLLVVDTGWKMCSISSEVVALVAEKAYGFLKCSPRRITLPEAPCPASSFLESHYHPTTEMVIEAVEEMVKK